MGIKHHGPSGQTLHVLVDKQDGTYKGIALNASGTVYSLSDPQLVTGGMPAIDSDYEYSIRTGAPSDTPSGSPVGASVIGWTGTAQRPLRVWAHNGNGDTIATTTDTGELGTAIAANTAAIAEIPANVRTELATELGRIDAAISSRMATFSYTAAPTASANASAVRTELATELARIDAAITSRMATFSYTAAPTASTVASAVRTELATELGRVDAAISSRLASVSYVSPPALTAEAVERFNRSAESMLPVVVGTGSTVNTIVLSSTDPAITIANQLKGRIIIFASDTTTAALQGQATDIKSNTTGTLTVSNLTTAPAAGDIAIIV